MSTASRTSPLSRQLLSPYGYLMSEEMSCGDTDKTLLKLQEDMPLITALEDAMFLLVEVFIVPYHDQQIIEHDDHQVSKIVGNLFQS